MKKYERIAQHVWKCVGDVGIEKEGEEMDKRREKENEGREGLPKR